MTTHQPVDCTIHQDIIFIHMISYVTGLGQVFLVQLKLMNILDNFSQLLIRFEVFPVYM